MHHCAQNYFLTPVLWGLCFLMNSELPTSKLSPQRAAAPSPMSPRASAQRLGLTSSQASWDVPLLSDRLTPSAFRAFRISRKEIQASLKTGIFLQSIFQSSLKLVFVLRVGFERCHGGSYLILDVPGFILRRLALPRSVNLSFFESLCLLE